MPRPDQQEPVVFELVEGEGPDGVARPVGAPPADSSGRRLPRLPRLSRRTWLVTVAVVAVVVAGTTAVDLVRGHLRAELMRTSPVGVASLAEMPERGWTVPFDVPTPSSDEAYVDQPLVTMDGLLVLPPGSAQSYTVDPFTGLAEAVPVGFDDVVAVDPGSGEVAWRVPLDEAPVCGPTSPDASMSVDALVCVHGPEGAREVLTVAPDGATRSRPVDLADGEQVFPGPDGMLVRVTRTGGDAAAEEVLCDDLGTCTPSVLERGRDVRVVAEDAATGAERWATTVEFRATETVNCQQQVADSGRTTVDTYRVTIRTGAESVAVDGCGVAATLSTQGVRLDLAGESGDDTGGAGDRADEVPASPAWVTEIGADLFAVETGSTETLVVDDEGQVLRTLPGWVRTATISPDAPDDLWFITRTGGYGFDAVRGDGSVAWTDRKSQDILLVGRDVVVADRGGRVVGLARETGDQVWAWDGGGMTGMVRYRTLTDGRTVAMEHLPQDGKLGGLLVALDLGTGEKRWIAPVAGTAVAVDGELVEVSKDGLTGLD
ncbi:PQQ-binding-like beta-propeller repeat protein [Promicromonospora kroppenstedtii]|uniref:outer membrane protein assembly factor BamB family protein n=1 Tax=Promicromonospora kroppenstedtii TaxID=440482 RepID=UPI0004B14E7B|nr:PQQ-binding-like beta-propeller repeat protein [Promicromonospora kroppenstedtii]